MKYIRENLLKNERLVYSSQIHWIVFVMPIELLILSLLVLIFGHHLIKGYLPFIHFPLVSIVSLVFFIAAIVAGIGALVRYATSEYGITNKRIIMKTGFISRNVLELFINKIEAIYVDQTIPGRMFNYGTIRVVGTGGTQDPFIYVPDPMAFKKRAEEQLSAAESTNPRYKMPS